MKLLGESELVVRTHYKCFFGAWEAAQQMLSRPGSTDLPATPTNGPPALKTAKSLGEHEPAGMWFPGALVL